MAKLTVKLSNEEIRGIATDRLNQLIETAKLTATENLKQRIDSVPQRYKRAYLEAITGEGGLANAIKAKCLECVNFEDVDSNIGDCQIRSCPINPYRPYRKQKA